MRLLFLFAVVGCASGSKDDEDTAPDPEACNGLDDDLDGVVDDGFDDADGDGIADCVDDSCDVPRPAAGTVEIKEECTGEIVVETDDPWNIVVEWGWSDPDGGGSYIMPAIGSLNDDDGDGDADIDDIPDIVFNTLTGYLVALSGDGSGELFNVAGFDYGKGTAIGDVDGDGWSEVITTNSGGDVAAIDETGATIWQTTALGLLGYVQPSLADIDADGTVEVVVEGGVVSGEDGTVEFTLGPPASVYYTTVVADLDLDGCQEIIVGEQVYDCTGALLWSGTPGSRGNFAAIVQVDGDDDGEVLFFYTDTVYTSDSYADIFDTDGTLLYTIETPGTSCGPPCAGDFDGDGEMEFALPDGTHVGVYEKDGTELWSASALDASGLAGCSAFDVDGDTIMEVLFADEDAVWVYDGATGAVNWSDTDHASGTVFEYPTVADVDNDGSAEMVVVSNYNTSGTYSGVVVYGQAENAWPGAGPNWPVHDYGTTNVDEYGAVPTVTEPYWVDPGVFRARPASASIARADLKIELGGTCVSDCKTGPAYISYQISNLGGADAEAGILVSLYAIGAEEDYLVETQELPAIPMGTSLDAGVFEAAPSFFGELGFRIEVDDDGTGSGALRECDEDNNATSQTGRICEL